MAAYAFQCDACGSVLKGAEINTWQGHTFPTLSLTGAPPEPGELAQPIEKYDLCTSCFRRLADSIKASRGEAAS